MELQAAKKLVEDVFNNRYDRVRYLDLVGNLLKSYNQDNKSINISNSSHQFNHFTFLGSYQNSNKTLGIYEVEVNNYKTLLNARVAQRNLIASELKKEGYDIGLASFYVREENQWRFSLITFESSIDLSSERIKFNDNLSLSKRQSFLAGKHEGSYTAKKQLLKILLLKELPLFDEIKEAFEIEPINDDFYEQYKELYLKLTDHLDKFIQDDDVIAKDFKDKEVLPSDFAKKTLGQFIFLYFIQKKGWIKNKNNPNEKFTITKLFEERSSYGENFFNDIIEPIFYESLAKEVPNSSVYSVVSAFDFPYLNGGLFEPIRGYDWLKTNIIIPDSFFRNDNKTLQGDNGDGLLDVFDRFNFTVYENDHIDQDIAVDPEMLGKVFENLLEIKKRKDNGAFYTPREIVQYICKESLIDYLNKNLSEIIELNEIAFFINHIENLTDRIIPDSKINNIINNALDIDVLLCNVRICDPAIGSGAFPMCMLNEILKLRNFLQHYVTDPKTSYEIKLQIISECLYGVDIDPSAVDIARLRFWLSLVLEEEDPIPLPNLEHKLMQGNSLVSDFLGIEIDYNELTEGSTAIKEKIQSIDFELDNLQKELISFKKINEEILQQKKIINNRIQSLIKQKLKLNQSFQAIPESASLFNEQNNFNDRTEKIKLFQNKITEYLVDYKKKYLKKEIDNLKFEIIKLFVDDESKINEIRLLKEKNIQQFFFWRLEFINVFREKSGFDIVIGNPPYGGEKISNDLRDKYNLSSKDAYGAFISLAINGKESLLNNNGFLGYIVSDTFMTIKSHIEVRKQLLRNSVKKIIRLHPDTFNATVNTAILLASKVKDKDNVVEISDLSNISIHDQHKKFIEIFEQTKVNKNENISNTLFSIFYFKQDLIHSNSNLPFFTGHPKFFALYNDNAEKNEQNFNRNNNSFCFNGQVLNLIALKNIADVKVGLQTGDNPYYLFQDPDARGRYKDISEYKQYILGIDDINTISSNTLLKNKIINSGIHKTINENNFDEELYFGGKYIIPYDKGGASDLNQGWLPNYFVPTEYYIDWSCSSVKRMKSLTMEDKNKLEGKSGGSSKLCSRFQNSNTYFKKGITFSWTGQYSPTFRVSTVGPYDHGSSAIFTDKYSIEYLLGVLCSKLIKYCARNFINHTVNFGIDDVKDIVIPFIESKELSQKVKELIIKQKETRRYDYINNEQIEIDNLVYKLFNLNIDDIDEIENWYARRYPKLKI